MISNNAIKDSDWDGTYYDYYPQTLTANSDSGAGSTVGADVCFVEVTAANAGVDDWIVLPSAIQGKKVTVNASVGANFEIRTPASSNETINNVDSDGSNEYLATDTDTIIFTCPEDGVWIGVSYTNLGAVRAAVVPD